MSSSDENVLHYSTEEEEKIIQELISRLKFISKIQINQIVDLKSFSVMQPSFSTSLYRTCVRMGSESREDVLLFFCNTINSSIDYANKYSKIKDKYHEMICHLILNALEQSKAGILNYKKTYAKDIMYCSKIETLLETFQVKFRGLVESLS